MVNPNICRWLMFGLLIVGLIIAVIGMLVFGLEPLSPLFLLGAAIGGGGILFGLVTLRCPHCRRLLPFRGVFTPYCPHCGQKIE